MTEAILAAGTKLYRGDSADAFAGQTWTEVLECKSIQLPALKQDFVDVTSLSSPGGEEEFIPSMKRKGNCTLQMNSVPGAATQDSLTGFIHDRNNKTKRRYKAVLPDTAGTLCTFLGYTEEVSQEAQMGNALMSTVSIKVTGDLLWGNAVTAPA